MSTLAQVNAVRARLLPDAMVQEIAPNIPLQALRAHLKRRNYDVDRVRLEVQRARVSIVARNRYDGHTDHDIRVFWPDGTVDRLTRDGL